MATWIFLATVFSVGTCFGQLSRDSYNELYAAGALGKVISDRVCFFDDPELDTFFMFTESKVIREIMIADGSFPKAGNSLQTRLKEDFLIFRGFNKGIPVDDEDIFTADHGSWVSARFILDKRPARIRFEIVRETLRFKRSVELLNPNGTVRSVVSSYGRCEVVSPEIKQLGK